ncbi:PcfJ domain-containing protein [uncultured Ferrimonas sp.]|uniref:PcfJ domain-containing protein n=1 Tax=uncultured Ferrimonas sp. TaxID=432640 RepID=UPI00260B1A22|nr:PcfJ domain-containing protein [uncultured Ferrimonas sp.]
MFQFSLSANHHLHIDTGSCQGLHCQLILSGWADGLIWWVVDQHGNRQRQQGHDLGIDLIPILEEKPQLQPFLASFPHGCLEHARLFGHNAFAILQLASRHRSVCELLQLRPTLLAMLYFLISDRSQLVQAANQGQRQALAVLDLPASKRSLALLDRYQTERYKMRGIQLLQRLLADAACMDRCRHQPVLNDWVLALAQGQDPQRRHPWLLGTPLLQVLCQPQHRYQRERLLTTIGDCDRLGHALGNPQRQRQIAALTNVTALFALHDRWTDRLNAQRPVLPPQVDLDEELIFTDQEPTNEPEGDYRYPLAPFAGDERLSPITTFTELCDEGASMRHCVRSYHQQLVGGNYFIYRVLQPERATLGLQLKKRLGRPQLQISQLQGPSNRAISPSTRDAVIQWLQQQPSQL